MFIVELCMCINHAPWYSVSQYRCIWDSGIEETAFRLRVITGFPSPPNTSKLDKTWKDGRVSKCLGNSPFLDVLLYNNKPPGFKNIVLNLLICKNLIISHNNLLLVTPVVSLRNSLNQRWTLVGCEPSHTNPTGCAWLIRSFWQMMTLP